jgi:hypothetical protein
MFKLLIPFLFVCACKDKVSTRHDFSVTDSLALAAKADSMTKSVIQKAFFDTVNVWSAPVKVTSAKIVKRENSSYRNVYLAWTNTSNKKVAGIKFKWYGVTAFHEPADMGGYFEGIGGGMTDRSLAPGKSDNGQWSVMSTNAKRVVCAWPYEVAYEDGTFWKQKQ